MLMHTCTCTSPTHACTCTRTCTHMPTHMCTHTRSRTCTHTHALAHAHAHSHAHTCTLTCTHTRTHLLSHAACCSEAGSQGCDMQEKWEGQESSQCLCYNLQSCLSSGAKAGELRGGALGGQGGVHSAYGKGVHSVYRKGVHCCGAAQGGPYWPLLTVYFFLHAW
jgi:hypothetical protein